VLRLTALAVIVTAMPGCSWQVAYSSAQGWQRNQCNRLVDQTERERCAASASMPYDEFRSRSEGTKKP
jgi:hypothetical protein